MELTEHREQALVKYCLLMAKSSHPLIVLLIKALAWNIVKRVTDHVDSTKPLTQAGNGGKQQLEQTFLSIVHILSSKPYCSIYFSAQSSYNFLGQPFFLLPVISSSIISNIWELMSQQMKWPYHCRYHYHIINLHNNTHSILNNINPIYQSHPTNHSDHKTLYFMQPCLFRNSKFQCFTKVQQTWSILLNLPLLHQR